MQIRFAVLLALLVPVAGSAQTARPSLLERADVSAEAAATARSGPLSRFSGPLRQIYAARQAYLADRAAGRTSETFEDAVALSAVVGETVLIDATAPTEAGVPALAADLARIGFVETGRYRHMISGYLPVDAIDDAAALNTLRSASAAIATTDRVSDEDADAPRARLDDARAVVMPGSVIGESSVALRAQRARSLFGVDGSGVIIGVISDSYNACALRTSNRCRTTATQGVASGDLPAGVNVLDEYADISGTDEGRAMIELAYDVAPAAGFAFHTAFKGQASFAQGIQDLIAAGADVVVDDVSYTDEPVFQDGIIAQSADAAFAAGVPYFSSAGNYANSAYDGTFTDSGLTLGGLPLHDFDPGPGVDAFQNITLAANGKLEFAFHYDEPSNKAGAGQAPTSDYDIYVLSAPDVAATRLAIGNDDNLATGAPLEFVQYSTVSARTVYIAIVKRSGVDRRMAYVNFNGGSSQAAVANAEYGGGATISSHSAAAGTFSTGAAAWFNAPTSENGLKEAVLESYSSYGGRLIRLAPDGTRLATPVARYKPDAVATDGDNNTFFGSDTNRDTDTLPNFFGTSAASPNLAAIAALMIDAAGGPGMLESARVYDVLRTTAEDVSNRNGTTATANANTAVGFDNRSGNGVVRADRAVMAVALGGLRLAINEVDVDQGATDTAEFVELRGTPGQTLDGLVVVGLDGATDQSYLTLGLGGRAVAADGLFALCASTVAGCDAALPAGTDVFRDDADAVALALGEPFDYVNGRLTAPAPSDRADALATAVGGDAPDAGLLAAAGQTITYDEGAFGNAPGQSLGRLNGPAYAAYDGGVSSLFYPVASTPGTPNPETITLRQTDIVERSGYRMLGIPFTETRTAGGVDVPDVTGGAAIGQLAAVNLVQGVPAGTRFPAEYPQGQPNLFTGYTGSVYVSPNTTDIAIAPGLGFFWYWFDADIVPAPGSFGGGTSRAHDLSGFSLSLGGVPRDRTFSRSMPAASDGFYMLANPFPYPLHLSGLTALGGSAFSTTVAVYDADGNQYRLLFNTESVGALQGFFAEVISGRGSAGSGSGPTVRFNAAAVDADLAAPDGGFIGRPAAEARLTFQVEGATASGERLADGSTVLRLVDGADDGWDAYDFSKPTPPGEHVQLALVGTRGGAAHRQAVLALPAAARPDVPLALTSTSAGPFTLAWTLAGLDAADTPTLRDVQTGTVTPLRDASSYTFDAAATDWTDRFVLSFSRPVADAPAGGPRFEIGPVAPNPTGGAAALHVRLAETEAVRATVVDMLGRVVAVLHDGEMAAGTDYRLALDARSLAPGAYVVRVQGPSFAETRRLTVAR